MTRRPWDFARGTRILSSDGGGLMKPNKRQDSPKASPRDESAERDRREKETEEWGGGEAQRSRLDKERLLMNPKK